MNFDPNKEMSKTSIVWYLIAVVLMSIAVIISMFPMWQTDGIVQVIYNGNVELAEFKVLEKPNPFSITPKATTMVWALAIYGAMLARKYCKEISNLPMLLLVVLNIFFTASLIESFLPEQSVCLLKIFRVEMINVNPRTILIIAILVGWLGMRSLSGGAILLLVIAFLSRAQELNCSLGMYGTFYIFCGFMSLIIQTRLPYMVSRDGWRASLMQDFCGITNAAKANVKESVSAAKKGASMATKAAMMVLADGGSEV